LLLGPLLELGDGVNAEDFQPVAPDARVDELTDMLLGDQVHVGLVEGGSSRGD
jgi:hypothetical protein